MITTIAKIAVFGIEYYLAAELIDIGILVLKIFDNHPYIELIWVMVIVPFTLNSM